jgi:hypothetical protein
MLHSHRVQRVDLRAMTSSTGRRESSKWGAQRRGLQPCDHALDSRREPPLGAHLVTPRHGYTHHGVYVGSGHVVQYGGLAHVLGRGPVEEVPLFRFSHGRPIWVRITESGWKDRPESASRARSRLGEDRYRVLTNNCEHFCEWCVRGQHRSYQVEALLGPYKRIRQRITESVPRIVVRLAAAGIKNRRRLLPAAAGVPEFFA